MEKGGFFKKTVDAIKGSIDKRRELKEIEAQVYEEIRTVEPRLPSWKRDERTYSDRDVELIQDHARKLDHLREQWTKAGGKGDVVEHMRDLVTREDERKWRKENK